MRSCLDSTYRSVTKPVLPSVAHLVPEAAGAVLRIAHARPAGLAEHLDRAAGGNVPTRRRAARRPVHDQAESSSAAVGNTGPAEADPGVASAASEAASAMAHAVRWRLVAATAKVVLVKDIVAPCVVIGSAGPKSSGHEQTRRVAARRAGTPGIASAPAGVDPRHRGVAAPGWRPGGRSAAPHAGPLTAGRPLRQAAHHARKGREQDAVQQQREAGGHGARGPAAGGACDARERREQNVVGVVDKLARGAVMACLAEPLAGTRRGRALEDRQLRAMVARAAIALVDREEQEARGDQQASARSQGRTSSWPRALRAATGAALEGSPHRPRRAAPGSPARRGEAPRAATPADSRARPRAARRAATWGSRRTLPERVAGRGTSPSSASPAAAATPVPRSRHAPCHPRWRTARSGDFARARATTAASGADA